MQKSVWSECTEVFFFVFKNGEERSCDFITIINMWIC